MKNDKKIHIPEDIILSPFAVEGRDYVVVEFTDKPQPKRKNSKRIK